MCDGCIAALPVKPSFEAAFAVVSNSSRFSILSAGMSMESVFAEAAAWTMRDREYNKLSQSKVVLSSAAISTPPNNKQSILSELLAIETTFSNPELVSIITWNRIFFSKVFDKSLSSSVISSALSNLVTITDNGGWDVAIIPSISCIPSCV